LSEERHRLPDKQPVLRVVPMPRDLNPNEDVFGGWVMGQVDIAGAVSAVRRANGPVVTVAINAFQFRKPIKVGELVSFYAEIVRVGHTSIAVAVEVYVERGPGRREVDKVTEATLTYVAIDADGCKRELPPEDSGP
jgi:acyl-CoA thioesterase YciA